MADFGISIALPAPRESRANIGAIVASIASAAANSVRKRRIYHRTLSELEGYSERGLLDIGASHGIEEFARRAARL